MLNGAKWDGSDFIYGGFISKRALRFLQKHKVSRYCVAPVEVDLEGVTPKQLKALRKAGCVDE